jgi:hypothetical protein
MKGVVVVCACRGGSGWPVQLFVFVAACIPCVTLRDVRYNVTVITCTCHLFRRSPSREAGIREILRKG